MKKIFSFVLTIIVAQLTMAATYTRVTSAPADWSGQYLVVYDNSGAADKGLVFKGEDAAMNTVEATITNGQIVADNLSEYAVEIAPMAGGYSIKVLRTGNYMGGKNGANTIQFNAATPFENTIALEGIGDILFTSNTSVLRYNKTSTITNGKETGYRFRYYKSTTYTKQCAFSLYKSDETVTPPEITVDTIGVSEALTRIKNNQTQACFIKGVVATEPSDPGSYGNTIFWMTDMQNSKDSIQGYKISGKGGANIATKADIPFALGDTIMVYASKLEYYQNRIFEINSGYYVETLGATKVEELNYTFAYAMLNSAAAGNCNWDLIIKANGTDEFPQVTLNFSNATDKGIIGDYKLAAPSTFKKSATETLNIVAGSLALTFNSKSANGYNNYNVNALIKTSDDKQYRIISMLEVPAYTSDFSEIALSEDVPFMPEDGDTITCQQAYDYAMSLANGASSEIEVTVVGYATEMIDKLSKEGQQTFWMADTKDGGKIFEAFYCYTPANQKVVLGTKVAVKGKITNYNNATAEIKNGQVSILEGGEESVRDITYEDVPADAITVAEALVIGNALEANATTDKEYTVKGYVAKVAFQVADGSGSWYMTDEKVDGSGRYDFQAYKCNMSESVVIGDYVFVKGFITKYVGESGNATIEIKQGVGHFALAEETAIEDVNVNPMLDINQPMFDILGQPVDAGYKGIVIQNGRKYLLY